MVDEYADAGEFLDVLSRDAWTALRDPVAAALAGADPAAGPLVDLGAGSGRGTRLLAELHAEATVLAVEPSPVQRAVLMARLMDDSGMAARVTVLAGNAETADLPDRLGGVLAMNMIGHLDPGARRELWRRIADRLAPGAPLVVNVQPPARAEAVPEAEFISVPVGRHRYVGSGRAEPAGPAAVTWHMRYRVCDELGVVQRELVAAYRWHVVTAETIGTELAAVGLAVQQGDYGLLRAAR